MSRDIDVIIIALGQIKLISSLAGLTHKVDAGCGVLILFFMVYLRCGTYFIIQISQNRSRNMEQVVLEMEEKCFIHVRSEQAVATFKCDEKFEMDCSF